MDNVPTVRHYVGIDVPLGYVTEKAVQRKEVPVKAAHMVRGDSRFTLRLPAGGSQSLTVGDLMRVDAAFVDGDHGYRGAMHDTLLAKGIVNNGGIIIWHDYHDLGNVDVREVLHDLAGSGERIWHIEGTWLAFQRVGIDDLRGAVPAKSPAVNDARFQLALPL